MVYCASSLTSPVQECIDQVTNVLIAANNMDPKWKTIASECANRLNGITNTGRLCIDSLGLILREYGNNLPSSSRKGFGDMFYLWVARIAITQNFANMLSSRRVVIKDLKSARR